MQKNFGYDIFDEEFKTYMKTAKFLTLKLTGEEKEVAHNWVKRLMNLFIHSSDANVKKVRNQFLKKIIEVIKQSVVQRVMNHPKISELKRSEIEDIMDEISKVNETLTTPTLDRFLKEENKSSDFMSLWSNDRRTYVAVKPIPGRGALVYMAVSEKPELGWSIPKKDYVE